QGGLNGGDVLIGHADAVGERTQHGLALLEGRQRPGTEALMLGLQLFEDIEAGALGRLLAQNAFQFLAGLIDLLLELPQSLLPVLSRLQRTQSVASRLQGLAMSGQSRLGGCQAFGDARQFIAGGAAALLGLRDIAESFAVLGFQFEETFFVEMNSLVVPVALR